MWFDRRMAGRSVLLLLDNFSAHQSALDNVELQNVRVVFLPPNATSVCQPCDQGIIRALKVHYRRHFTRWCLERWECGSNPIKEVNLLMAIRWVVSAWELDVRQTSIENCFRKSGVMGPKNTDSNDLQDDETPDDLSEGSDSGK